MRFRLLLLALLLAAEAGVAHAENLYPLGKVTLQLKWFHQFQFAGYYAAVEKGYYREAGLEVVLKEGSPGMVFSEEVVSGRAEYGIHSTDLLVSRVKGQPVVVLASIFQHSPLVLLSLKKNSLDSPQSFTGKRVMVSPDAEAEIYSLFGNEGMDQKRIRYIPHTWNIEDLIDGKADAASAYSTNELIQLRLRGFEAQVVKPLTYGIDFYSDCLYTSERELRKHPDRVKSFLAASLRGWEYAMDHTEEVVDLLLSKYKARKSREVLRLEAEAMRSLIVPDLVPIGFMNPGRWRFIGETYARLGAIPKDFSLDGFLYEPDRSWISPGTRKMLAVVLLFLTAAGAALTVLFARFNRKLAAEVAERTESLTLANRRLEREIREGQRREEEIGRTLAERETLLKEVHHRVKNNLQVIVSLVNLQINSAADAKAESILMNIKHRVQGMALVHQYLYLSETLSRIDMQGYLRSLVSALEQSYGRRGGERIAVEVAAEGIFLSIESAIPVGLIVTETVSNSFKYAFEGLVPGRVRVELAHAGEKEALRLVVEDDGKGVLPETAVRKPGSLGLKLVEALAVQLHASLNMESAKGFRVIVDGIRDA